MKYRYQITIRLDSGMDVDIEALADQRGLSKAAMGRFLLNKGIEILRALDQSPEAMDALVRRLYGNGDKVEQKKE